MRLDIRCIQIASTNFSVLSEYSRCDQILILTSSNPFQAMVPQESQDRVTVIRAHLTLLHCVFQGVSFLAASDGSRVS